MADVIGRGTIELVADARKLKAGIEDAKRSLRTLGEGQKDISKGASQSIDRFIGKLQQQNATFGKSARETELFKLALRGASNEQLNLANAALLTAERQALIGKATSAAAVGLAAMAAAAVVAAIAFDKLVNSAGNFQDLAEKVGDTGENIASLAVAAAVGGVSMDELASASIKLNKSLVGVDDESKAAGAAVEALGLNLKEFKNLAPADQIEAVANAMAKFADSQDKGNVAVALFGKSGAQLLPFFKELAGATGRVNILTAEQIRLADDYSDRQKRLTAEIGLQAEAFATDLLPTVNSFLEIIRDVAKELDVSGIAVAALTSAFNGLVVLFQTALVVGSDVAFVFKAIGREVAAVAAQFAALQRLDFKGFSAIGDAVKEDARIARAELDKFQRDVLAVSKVVTLSKQDAAQNSRELRRSGVVTPPDPRQKIKFSGAEPKPKKDNTADQEAKAQLALELENIRNSSEAIINELKNREKIVDAFRSAQTDNEKQTFDERIAQERAFFAEKRGIAAAETAEQERAINAEIALLEKQKFTGKDAVKERLDNERKVAESRAKLTKIQADSATELTVSNIQEAASIQKVREEQRKLNQAFDDARISSQAYIDSIKRRNEAELAGIGAGNQARQIQAGRSAIDEKFVERRLELERDLRNGLLSRDVFEQYLRVAQDTYSQEIILYDERTEAILKAQGDWINGAREGLSNYIDDTKNVAQQTEEIFTKAFQGAEDALLEFTKSGKLNFKDLVTSILSDIARMAIKQNITGPLADLVKNGGILEKIGSIFAGGGGGSLNLGSLDPVGFEQGTNFVPKTGLYKLHEGERVVTKEDNRNWGGSVVNVSAVFAPGTDTRTVNQGAVEIGRRTQQALARLT